MAYLAYYRARKKYRARLREAGRCWGCIDSRHELCTRFKDRLPGGGQPRPPCTCPKHDEQDEQDDEE